MENSGLTASDVALMTRDNSFSDGNAFLWIFALLILAGGGLGNFGFGNAAAANAIGYENLATSNEVQRGFDNQNLQAQTRDILSAVTGGTATTTAAITNGTAQAVAATNQAKYDNINVMKDVQAAITAQISDVKGMEQNILANQDACCCSTKMLIAETGNNLAAQMAQNKYESSMQIAGLEQKILSKMDADKIEALQNQINQLQLAQATSGMLKFPNSWTYGAGFFPPIFPVPPTTTTTGGTTTP